MEESQEILLNSLANSGVEIPAGVSSIQDLTPASLVSICAQSLNLIHDDSSFPTSLPESMADRFKICTELASAVKYLGFIGDMNFHKFLYPSEDDLYKLVRFLVERLSELSEHGKGADGKGVVTGLKIEDDFKGASTEWTGTDREVVNLNDKKVRKSLKDLKLKSEASEYSSKTEPCETHPLLYNVVEAAAVVSKSNSGMQDFSGSEVRRVQNHKNVEASIDEESATQRDDKGVPEHDQKLLSLRLQSSRTRFELQKLRDQEKLLIEETTTKSMELRSLEEEHELLKAATEMVVDDQHPTDFFIAQLNEQVDLRRRNLVEMEFQRDTLRNSLEEKKKKLEEMLATRPEAQKLKDIELEIQFVLYETTRREEELAKLSALLENQLNVATRRSYIQRITEITKNSRKQDADIERIIKETRELHLESNSIQERLHRTYAVVDEIVFRESKKDPVARQAYRLLTSIHDSFEQITGAILAMDRTRREVTEHEAKLAALASQSLNIDKLEADLDAIRKENKFLELKPS